ncbi:hypothetical protein [Cognatiyoonia sp. IB215182]|uniref:NACHT domain-containing protein n=1 Tax=Cognatiyoonia sp. IB215182 TaxID=3097353 RepID=UPI002A24B847|nr:hypothetical protein [Cognatiyoonia sp. IB215182]
MAASPVRADNTSPEVRLGLVFDAAENLPPDEALAAIEPFLGGPELIVSLGATVAIVQLSDQIPVDAGLKLLAHSVVTENDIEALESVRKVLRLVAENADAFLPHAGVLQDASRQLLDRAEATENGELRSLALGLEARAENLSRLQLRDQIESVLAPLAEYGGYLTPIIVLMVWYSVVGLTFLMRPILVPRLGQLESFVVESRIPVVGSLVGLLALARRLTLHPRVIDAWIQRHAPKYMASFNNQAAVAERSVVIPLPIEVDGTVNSAWQTDHLGSLSQQVRLRIVVMGEGGSGKTHVALRIAHALADKPTAKSRSYMQRIPVLIGREIEAIGKDINSPEMLVALVAAKLSEALPDVYFTPNFVRVLLASGRLLIIFDGFSEYAATVRTALQPDSPEFAAQAVIITTRDTNFAAMLPHVKLSPARISGSAVPSFLNAYLNEAGLRGAVSDHDLLRASYRLSGLGQRRSVTPLLARLFALQLANGEMDETDRLSSAEIMLSYVKGLNDSAGDTGLDTRALFGAASSLAYEAVSSTLQPSALPWEKAVEAAGGEDTLLILKERLTLIQSVGLTEDRLIFVFDPVAEYLAAHALYENNGTDALAWRGTFETMERLAVDPQVSEGFLRAINEVFDYHTGHPSPALLQNEEGPPGGEIATWLRAATQPLEDN